MSLSFSEITMCIAGLGPLLVGLVYVLRGPRLQIFSAAMLIILYLLVEVMLITMSWWKVESFGMLVLAGLILMQCSVGVGCLWAIVDDGPRKSPRSMVEIRELLIAAFFMGTIPAILILIFSILPRLLGISL